MPDEEAPAPEDELREQLSKLQVVDVLVTSVFQISSLGYHKLSKEHRDLEQARLAIDALRSLAPVVGAAVPEQVRRDLEQMLANMQIAYADAAKDG